MRKKILNKIADKATALDAWAQAPESKYKKNQRSTYLGFIFLAIAFLCFAIPLVAAILLKSLIPLLWWVLVGVIAFWIYTESVLSDYEPD